MTAHAAVISRDALPSAEQIARLKPGLSGMPWSWIAAGPDRRTTGAGLASDRGQPQLHDAGAVGLLAGRQKALEILDADIIVYLDDDVTLPVGWAEKILAPFSNPDVHFVGCRYLPDYAHEPPAWMESLWRTTDDGFRILGYLSLLDGGDVSRLYSPMLVWGLCFAARKETVIKLGGFNPDGYPWSLRRFRGDGETGLSAKANILGLGAYYQADAHVLHAVPAERMTPQYLARRSYLQGISDSYTEIRYKGEAPAAPKSRPIDLARRIKWQVEEPFLMRGRSSADIHKLLTRSYIKGRKYHEGEIRRDPRLLDWILKANYGDGSLPEGWRTYLDR